MSRKRAGRVVGGIAVVGAAIAAGYAAYRMHRRWGVSDDELDRPMAGDGEVQSPNYRSDRAVLIHARPEEIWPWLVQMGWGRGGFYSYDWVDQLIGFLDRPSADEILPQYQFLRSGDVIPMGTHNVPVLVVDPNRALVLGSPDPRIDATWSIGLYPVDGESTRIVSRMRACGRWSMESLPVALAAYPGELLMTRKWMLGIKRRAEAAADRRRAVRNRVRVA